MTDRIVDVISLGRPCYCAVNTTTRMRFEMKVVDRVYGVRMPTEFWVMRCSRCGALDGARTSNSHFFPVGRGRRVRLTLELLDEALS